MMRGSLRFRFVSGIALVLLLGLPANVAQTTQPSAASQAADVVLYEEDFEDGKLQGWYTQGDWQIVHDTDGNSVLRGREHNWASYQGETWADFTYVVRVKILRGRCHLNYRLSGCLRYFVTFDEDSVLLYKTSPCGNHQQLRSREVWHGRGRWHEIKVVGKGNRLEIYVNGWSVLTFVDPQPLSHGTIGIETLPGAEFYFDDIRVIGPKPPTLGLLWTRTSGPRGGIGYDVRIHPVDHHVLWVTDAHAGAHRSSDGGLSWIPMNSGITARVGPSGDAIPIFSLTIDPNRPDTIWVGTQGMRGVFKSVDGGKTWMLMENGVDNYNNMEIRAFTVDPKNSDIVYMGGNYTPNPSELAVRGLIYKTTDGGKSWTKILEPGALVRWIVVDPTNTNVIYASTGIFDRIAVKPEGILKSTDGGRNWFPVNDGLTSLAVGGLVMHPDNPQVLFATTGKASCFLNEPRELYGAVFKTTDGGRHWRKVYPRGGDFEVRFSAVAFAPGNPDIVYVDAGWMFLRSTDGGETWVRYDTSPKAENRGQPIALAVHPQKSDLIYMNAYDGGVFLSDDGGRTWVDASAGYTGSQAWDIAVAPDRVVVGSKNGVHVSSDGGQSWQGRNTEGWINNISAVAVDRTVRGTVLIGNEIAGWIRMTTDGGQTWREVLPSLGVDTPTQRITIYQIVFAPSDPNIIYAATGIGSLTIMVPREVTGRGVYKSTNGGQRWFAVNQGLEGARLNCVSLAVYPRDANIVYVGTLDSGVFKSTDGGKTWVKSSQGLRVGEVRALAIDPSNPDVIYAGTENSAVFKSVDGGRTWRQSSAGMNPEASIRSIVVDPSRPQTVYAADRRTGVYRSEDGGGTWWRLSEGLTIRAVNRLAISADGKVVYAATEGGGVFRLDLTQQGAGR